MPDDPGAPPDPPPAPPPPLLAGEGLSESGDGVPLTLENTEKRLASLTPYELRYMYAGGLIVPHIQ